MKTKLFLTAVLVLNLFGLSLGQGSFFSRPVASKTPDLAQLEVNCANCSDISDILLTGESIRYEFSFTPDSLQTAFKKTFELEAGDYSVCIKRRGHGWKTVHVYILKNERQELTLN